MATTTTQVKVVDVSKSGSNEGDGGGVADGKAGDSAAVQPEQQNVHRAFKRDKRLMVCMDGSEGSYEALAQAVAFARPENGDTIILINMLLFEKAVSPAAFLSTDHLTSGLQSYSQQRTTSRSVLANAVSFLTHLSASIPRPKVIEVEQVTHDVREAIVEFATTNNVDIVFMGSRGVSKVKSLLLGSVSDYVIRRAPCPVLIARYAKPAGKPTQPEKSTTKLTKEEKKKAKSKEKERSSK